MNQSKTKTDPKIIVALDYDTGDKARAMADQLDPQLCKLKVGKELFTRSGPMLVRDFVSQGFKVFLDLKFHDIPNTVAKACAAAADLGVWMMNVHAQGGSKMMQAAFKAIETNSGDRPLLIAVTILTSLSDEDIHATGLQGDTRSNVLRLATLTEQAGLDGVVCSPLEVSMLRQTVKTEFKLVTPGIRPAGSATDDQARIMTPKEAIAAGSDYLVIGRPVTQASDPIDVLQSINAEIN